MELWRDGPEESLQQLMNDLVLLEQPSFIYAGGGAGARTGADAREVLKLRKVA